ncbi:MAG: dihydroorotase [Deltaproteobacteria bacterium]|nr:dihydroorotase [Deltaproteobacteria bacterium]MBW2664063.1 dihydroorotase [Deltaproteobacteria bacterium]
MLTLIKGGRVIDPGNLDGIMDILIEDGKIVEIKAQRSDVGAGLKPAPTRKTDAQIINASGKIVTPGLIDMHVHFREPGHEYKETIETGCLSAAFGGFTAVCTMPNTIPVNDNTQVTEYILKKARLADTVRVYPVAAISPGLNGKGLCEYGELKEAGAIAFSDDGNPVRNSRLMRRALEYAKGFGLPIISHCEELDLVAGGMINEGAVATRMGLAGIPNAAESIMVMRDIALCELTGASLHIAHVSTAESVRAIRNAKKRGVPVTAETAPHYFSLTEEAVKEYNTNAKMNPPLRSEHDREAVLEGLSDGTIDVIATDHAPHSSIEKEVEFDLAANGIIGLETSLPLGMKLIETGIIPLTELIKKMSTNPARILGLDCGIKKGGPADITIIDPDISFKIDAANFQSLSRNTPFDGWDMKGKAVLTMVGGKIVYDK